MILPDLRELRNEEPIVGHSYLVPCLYVGPWSNLFSEKQAPGTRYGAPVLAKDGHTDPELGNARPHYHLDYRFADEELLIKERLLTNDGFIGQYRNKAWVVAGDMADYYRVVYEPRPCLRQLPVGGGWAADGIRQEAQKYIAAGKRLNLNCMTCPHKGTPLHSVRPDARGRISCPAHGMCFDKATGEVVL